MSVRRLDAIRFAIGSPQRHSSIWRLWINPNKSDVYIAARALGGTYKVSLHESGEWHVGFTDPNSRFLRPGQSRMTHRWTRPPEFFPGLTHAFSVVVPNDQLRPPLNEHPASVVSKVKWIEPSNTSADTQVSIGIETIPQRSSDWPGQRSPERPTRLVGNLPLPTGENVWLVAHDGDLAAGVRSKIEFARERGREMHAEQPDADLRGLAFGWDRNIEVRFFIDTNALPEDE